VRGGAGSHTAGNGAAIDDDHGQLPTRQLIGRGNTGDTCPNDNYIASFDLK